MTPNLKHTKAVRSIEVEMRLKFEYLRLSRSYRCNVSFLNLLLFNFYAHVFNFHPILICSFS